MSDELAEGSRRLIERALREERRLPAAGVDSIRRRVVSVSAGVALGAGIGKAAAASSGVSALLVPALKGIALGVLVSGSVHFGQRAFHAPARTAASAEDPAPFPITPSAPKEPAAPHEPRYVAAPAGASAKPPVEVPSSTVPRAPAATATSASPSAAPSVALPSLNEELAVLDRVQQALKAGDGATALDLLDESAASLGHGSLRQERLAAEVLAACAAGNVARARRAAERFLAEDSGTPAALRVRASCAGDKLRTLP